MIKILVLLVGFGLAGVAQAQIKCWTGADGKRSCGDTPPPGVRLETPKGAPAPQPRAPAAAEPKAAPPAASPQGKAQSQKAAAKHSMKAVSTVNDQECERAQKLLQATGGGGRSKRTDAVRARALADNNCR